VRAAWIVAGLLAFCALTLAAVGVLLSGDPEGRGWVPASRCFVGALGVGALDALLVACIVVRHVLRFLGVLTVLLSFTRPAHAAEPDWQAVSHAAALAAAETDVELCAREAAVTGRDRAALCAKRAAALVALRAELDAIVKTNRKRFAMRLAELEPKWWAEPGRVGQGVVFRCPHCRATWLCVAFANPLDGGAPWDIGTNERRPISKLWDVLYGPLAGGRYQGAVLQPGDLVVPPGHLWTRHGEAFEALTLAPSVDASAAGCWHGFLQNGAVTC
jgi:hypothetical protein